MKVLDRQCAEHHVFEGWFASEDDFQSQLTRGLVTCPLCGDASVTKMLSAPRLNLHTTRGERGERDAADSARANAAASSASSEAAQPTSQAHSQTGSQTAQPAAQQTTSQTPPSASQERAATTPSQLPSLQEVANLAPAQLQAALLKMVRHVVANTEDVGHDFAEEARKMHYGEAEQRNIRGHATPAETEALIDEGIAVMPLPLPDLFKEPLQ